MAFTTGILLAAGLVGAGVDELVHGIGDKKSSAPPGLPTLPSMDTAQATAQDAQTQQRRIALATGGQTDFTGGTGVLLGSDVSHVSLVGG